MKTQQMSVRPSLQKHASASVYLHRTSLRYEQTHPTRRSSCTLDHLHPPTKRDNDTILNCELCVTDSPHFTDMLHIPFKSVFTFSPEKVHVGFKLEFEDVLLVDAVRLLGSADGVAKQRQACQWEVVLQQRCVLT